MFNPSIGFRRCEWNGSNPQATLPADGKSREQTLAAADEISMCKQDRCHKFGLKGIEVELFWFRLQQFPLPRWNLHCLILFPVGRGGRLPSERLRK
jgi:hypothetical protein